MTGLLCGVVLFSVMVPSVGATTRTITITGTVSDPGGAGVEGVEVSAWTPGGGEASAGSTDAQGRYQLSIEAGSIHMHAAAPVDDRLAERTLDAGWHDASFTKDISLEAGSLLAGTVVTPSGRPLHGSAWLRFQRLIEPFPETEWLTVPTMEGSASFSIVVPRDVIWIDVTGVDPFHSPRIAVDTRSGDVSGFEVALSVSPIHPYGYGPPVAERVTIGEIDDLGEAEITGAPGAVLPLSRVLLVNLCSSHQSTAIADAHGGFTARVFAPPGSALLIKHGPADPRWGELERGMSMGATAFPGTIFEVPFEQGWSFADVGADHVVVDDLAEEWNTVGSGWWIVGDITPDGPVPPGGTVEIQGRLRIASPALDATTQAANLNVGGFLTLAPIFDHEGRALPSEDFYLSTRLTPTGFPIQSRWRPRIDLGPVLSFTPFMAIGEHLAEAEFSATVQVPDDLPSGTYRPIAELGIDGSPESSSWIAAHLWGPTFFPSEVGMTPLVVGNGPSAPGERRTIWRLLFNRPMLGVRGSGALEDAGRFQMATQIVSQGAPYVAPPFDPGTGSPIAYRLEPYLPMMGFTDRRFSPRPWLPLRLPGGELRVSIEEPDGSRLELGPAPFVQATVQSQTTAAGWDFNPGTSQIDDVYSLTTGDPSFEVTFNQYGRHVITMEGEVEDAWGNVYSGGGTYELWVAHPLDLDPGVLPGTPLAVGDVVNPTVQVHPPVPATVELLVTKFPDSDPAQATSEVAYGIANRFGLLASPSNAPAMDRPGEFRADLVASWVAPNGALFMGAQAWGGIVMTPPADAELAAHGRRGLDCLEYVPPAWFIAPLDLTVPVGSVCHAFNPYYAGDVLWSRLGEDAFGGEALLAVATIHDLSGSHRMDILERYQRMAILEGDDEMEARFSAGELPIFTSTRSGRPPLLYPDEIDQFAYAYRSSQRPGVRVREVVSDESFDGGYWRLDTLYDDQPGVGLLGDQPNDFKLQYVGVVFQDLDSGERQYLGQGSGWVYMHDDDPGDTRVMPPYAGEGNGGWTTEGGPLMTVDGEDIHLFMVPTGTHPGAILVVGEQFRVAGHLMPPLASRAEVTVTAPDGRSWSFDAQANSVGYLFDPASDLTVDVPGVWTAEVRLWHEGSCSGGQTIPPYPSGSVLGAVDNRFEFYVVPEDAPELTVTSPRPGRLPIHGRSTPVEIRARLPGEATVFTTIAMPGIILDQSTVTVDGREFELVYDPETLNQTYPNIDLVGRDDIGPGLADTILITLLAVGADDSAPWYRAATVSIQGEHVAVGSRVFADGPRRPTHRLSP